MGLSRPINIGTVSHNQLIGRGESEAHPITAVKNLDGILSQLALDVVGGLTEDDIVNDLTTGGTKKPASAEMVKTLNGAIQLIDTTGMLTTGDVQDTLTSTSKVLPLSADKGRELFQYANDGKTGIATAINNRGVTASPSNTFPELATKIGEIAPAPSIIGDAVATEVLSGKTFSTASLSGASGTMPNHGAKTLTPGASNVPIPAGYHNGSGVVSAVAGLVAGAVANNSVVGGVTGNYKGLGNATAGEVLTGKTFSTASLSNASGTMPNHGAKTLTPGASNVPIPAGYHNGSGVVSAVAGLVASVIKKDTVVGGVTGTLAPAPVFSGDSIGGRAGINTTIYYGLGNTGVDGSFTAVNQSFNISEFLYMSSPLSSPGGVQYTFSVDKGTVYIKPFATNGAYTANIVCNAGTPVDTAGTDIGLVILNPERNVVTIKAKFLESSSTNFKKVTLIA